MSYREFLPHPALRTYIDAYWTISTGREVSASLQRIFPDGCTDIIFNRGESIYGPNREQLLPAEASMLVGMMTSYTDTMQSSNNALIGIRFKPGALACFYRLALHEFTDLAIPFTDPVLRELIYGSDDLLTELNRYFLRKLPTHPGTIISILDEIEARKGCLKVAELTAKFAMSERKLERLFKKDVGLTVKGMVRLSRFTNTLRILKQNGSERGLSEIAYACGYYDQAHLCKEIKAFSGLTPAQL